MATRKQSLSAKDLVDLAIAVVPLVVIVAIQYKDEINLALMWLERRTRINRADEGAAMRQVQKEISWMEHEVPDG